MLNFRMADSRDVDLLFAWSSDSTVRENSYSQNAIEYQDHVRWFQDKLNLGLCFIYIFFNEDNIPVGQVRIEKDLVKREATIGIIVDPDNRGKGYSSKMIEKASSDFLDQHPAYKIMAFIMKKNSISYSSFVKAGYKLLKEEIFKGFPSYILYKDRVK